MLPRSTPTILVAISLILGSSNAYADSEPLVAPNLLHRGVDSSTAVPSAETTSAPLQGSVESKLNSTPPLQGGVETKITPAAPLQGGVETKITPAAPLQGGVETKVSPASPLQGGVEQKVATPTLQPGVGKFASEPLHGAVDQTGKPPLQGAVQDTQRNALQGKVSDQGITLGARTPNYSAVMRILQFKKTDAVPVVKPPPITQDEIEKARFRDNVNLDKAPVRSEETGQPRPLRGQTTDLPAHLNSSTGRPQRTALSVPHRPDQDGAPSRTVLSIDSPPLREEEGGWLTPPSRKPLAIPQPPTRLELNPMLSERSNDGANVRPAGDDNSRILQPPPRSDVAVAPRRADQNGLQEPAKKKKRDKKINANVKPTASPQAVPELAAAADEMLLWDRWYQHVNDLLCAALRTTMPKHGNPAGTNRVHITVWADHRLEPRLVESNNPNFDAAIIEAYKSLNGSAELAFPKGTQRNQNEYETSHIQEIPAATAAFDSRTVRGDLETIVK